MKFIERRLEPRFPVTAGFLEIGQQTLRVDSISEAGVGFFTTFELDLKGTSKVDGFLVLQHQDDQYEIPIELEIRRISGDYVGAVILYKEDTHREIVSNFIQESSQKE